MPCTGSIWTHLATAEWVSSRDTAHIWRAVPRLLVRWWHCPATTGLCWCWFLFQNISTGKSMFIWSTLKTLVSAVIFFCKLANYHLFFWIIKKQTQIITNLNNIRCRISNVVFLSIRSVGNSANQIVKKISSFSFTFLQAFTRCLRFLLSLGPG